MPRAHRPLTALVLLAAAACGAEDSFAPPLTHERLAALAAVGVGAIERDGEAYLLYDHAGTQIGVARVGDAEAAAELRGDRVHTATDTDGTVLSCNAATVELNREDKAIPVSSAAAVDPCGDALIVLETLADEGDDASIDDHHLRSGAGCTYLGRNGYCDGETRVISHDWLCFEDEHYHVFTNIEVIERAEQCLGCCY